MEGRPHVMVFINQQSRHINLLKRIPTEFTIRMAP